MAPGHAKHMYSCTLGEMQSLSKLIFGPTKEERVRAVQQRLRQEQRALDREVRHIDSAISKTTADIKRLAKKGDTRSATLLAKEVVRAKKHRSRLTTSKAQLNSISMQLQQQLEMSATMREMSGELMKAGILEEMMEDTLEASALGDGDDIEDEANAEVDKVLYEITDGKLGEASSTSQLPELEDPQANVALDENIQDMQSALDSLLRG
ncbi:Vacuolar protein-sorting-associated protein 24 [Malassezia cuniculi]|uniref:Vacuolar protein-sorting-associated protein 24 n=1 Tax=Malassezia cuniculi TaxID=948313 RepID=A0AAF0ENP3_9BASI|nr:Vacuolar protein-sorting-associated protein 24 [Malassezia cuniculi]